MRKFSVLGMKNLSPWPLGGRAPGAPPPWIRLLYYIILLYYYVPMKFFA